MSKAEDRAAKKTLETFPILFGERMGYDKTNLQKQRRNAYEKGYHQAEKDLELTWEDMMIIHKCIKDAMNFHLYKMMEGLDGQKIVYQEVLKRFKAQKGE